MHESMWSLILHASLFVKLILLTLVVFSTVCWGIILYKHASLAAAEKESAAFLNAFESGNLLRAADLAKALQASPLAAVFRAVYPARATGEELRRLLRRYQTLETERLYAQLTFLATTGSTAPFIGLLGTVWGIINAFRGIGASGTPSLAVFAPGIAEALITTAAGLAAAIPAVMAYNHYLSRARKLAVALDDFSESLVSALGKPAS